MELKLQLDSDEHTLFRQQQNAQQQLGHSDPPHQPDCPICTRRYRPYLVSQQLINPEQHKCCVCGFDFAVFAQCSYHLNEYYKKTNTTPSDSLKQGVSSGPQNYKLFPDEAQMSEELKQILTLDDCRDHVPCVENRQSCTYCASKPECRKWRAVGFIMRYYTLYCRQQAQRQSLTAHPKVPSKPPPPIPRQEPPRTSNASGLMLVPTMSVKRSSSVSYSPTTSHSHHSVDREMVSLSTQYMASLRNEIILDEFDADDVDDDDADEKTLVQKQATEFLLPRVIAASSNGHEALQTPHGIAIECGAVIDMFSLTDCSWYAAKICIIEPQQIYITVEKLNVAENKTECIDIVRDYWTIVKHSTRSYGAFRVKPYANNAKSIAVHALFATKYGKLQSRYFDMSQLLQPQGTNMEASMVLLKGWMSKRGKNVKSTAYKARFFEIRNNRHMYYYRDAQSPKIEYLGVIDLGTIQMLKINPDESKPEFIMITANAKAVRREWHFKCKTSAILTDFMSVLYAFFKNKPPTELPSFLPKYPPSALNLKQRSLTLPAAPMRNSLGLRPLPNVKGKILYRGAMEKKGEGLIAGIGNGWKRRYFALTSDDFKLHYFQMDSNSSNSKLQYKSFVDLRSVQRIQKGSADGHEKKRYCHFNLVTMNRTWEFRVHTQHARTDWLQHLDTVCRSLTLSLSRLFYVLKPARYFVNNLLDDSIHCMRYHCDIDAAPPPPKCEVDTCTPYKRHHRDRAKDDLDSAAFCKRMFSTPDRHEIEIMELCDSIHCFIHHRKHNKTPIDNHNNDDKAMGDPRQTYVKRKQQAASDDATELELDEEVDHYDRLCEEASMILANMIFEPVPATTTGTEFVSLQSMLASNSKRNSASMSMSMSQASPVSPVIHDGDSDNGDDDDEKSAENYSMERWNNTVPQFLNRWNNTVPKMFVEAACFDDPLYNVGKYQSSPRNKLCAYRTAEKVDYLQSSPSSSCLKHELLSNCVTEEVWAMELIRCKRIVQTNTAHWFSTGASVACVGSLRIEHVLALSFYCTNDLLACRFRDSFHDKLKSADWYWFGRFLLEAVAFCGKNMDTMQTQHKRFYVGLNKRYLLRSFRFYAYQPLSSSTEIRVAQNVACNTTGSHGVVLEIDHAFKYNSIRNNNRFIDCRWISENADQEECLFFSSSNTLLITSMCIWSANNNDWRELRFETNAINYFSKISTGFAGVGEYNVFIDHQQYTLKKVQRFLGKLIEFEVDQEKTINDVKSEILRYVHQLFHHFVYTKTGNVSQNICSNLLDIDFSGIRLETIHPCLGKHLFVNPTDAPSKWTIDGQKIKRLYPKAVSFVNETGQQQRLNTSNVAQV